MAAGRLAAGELVEFRAQAPRVRKKRNARLPGQGRPCSQNQPIAGRDHVIWSKHDESSNCSDSSMASSSSSASSSSVGSHGRRQRGRNAADDSEARSASHLCWHSSGRAFPVHGRKGGRVSRSLPPRRAMAALLWGDTDTGADDCYHDESASSQPKAPKWEKKSSKSRGTSGVHGLTGLDAVIQMSSRADMQSLDLDAGSSWLAAQQRRSHRSRGSGYPASSGGRVLQPRQQTQTRGPCGDSESSIPCSKRGLRGFPDADRWEPEKSRSPEDFDFDIQACSDWYHSLPPRIPAQPQKSAAVQESPTSEQSAGEKIEVQLPIVVPPRRNTVQLPTSATLRVPDEGHAVYEDASSESSSASDHGGSDAVSRSVKEAFRGASGVQQAGEAKEGDMAAHTIWDNDGSSVDGDMASPQDDPRGQDSDVLVRMEI